MGEVFHNRLFDDQHPLVLTTVVGAAR